MESLNKSKCFKYKRKATTPVPFDGAGADAEKKVAGKAMYKISTINTIFIIDMLQNKVP